MFLTMMQIDEIHKRIQNENIDLKEETGCISAISQDKKNLIVIRKCRMDRNENGSLSHFFPNSEGNGANEITCLIWNQLDSSYSTCSGYPIPDSFVVHNAKFVREELELEDMNGKKISFTFDQISSGMWDISFGDTTMEKIEHIFYHLQDVEIAPPSKQNFPKTTTIKNIGTFKYNPETGEYERKYNDISLSLQASCDKDVMKQIKKVMQNVWDNKELYEQKAKEESALKLLELKNKTWLDENEQPVTKIEFMNRMDLITINTCERLFHLLFVMATYFGGMTL